MTKSKLLKEIGNAFCWEGDAFSNIKSETDTEMIVSVTGSSQVEHRGDEEGIQDQVIELRERSFKIDGIWYEIIDTSCNVEPEPHGDQDYTVKVSGLVTLKKRKD